MLQFRDQYFEDYIDLFRDFEVKKMEIDRKDAAVVKIRMPLALTDLVKDRRSINLQDAIAQTEYSSKVMQIL